MKQYIDLGKRIIMEGRDKRDRTGTGTRFLVGANMRFDLREGFPLLTTKHVGLKNIVTELLFFVQGRTNARWLNARGCKIWDQWAYPSEDVMYESQALFQRLENLAKLEKENPERFGGRTEAYKEKMAKQEWENGEKPSTVGEYLLAKSILDELRVPEVMIHTDKRVVPGDLGPVYGAMWTGWPDLRLFEEDEELHESFMEITKIEQNNVKRRLAFRSINQMQELISGLMLDPYSRRLRVTGWNVGYLPYPNDSYRTNVEKGNQALPPCHVTFQVFVEPMTEKEVMKENGITYDELMSFTSGIPFSEIGANLKYMGKRKDGSFLRTQYISLQMEQRSVDFPLGAPYNIASYAMLCHWLAERTDMVAKDLIYNMGDVHVYRNQMEKFMEQIKREPRELPTLRFTGRRFDYEKFDPLFDNLDDYFVLENYDPHDKVVYPTAAA